MGNIRQVKYMTSSVAIVVICIETFILGFMIGWMFGEDNSGDIII